MENLEKPSETPKHRENAKPSPSVNRASSSPLTQASAKPYQPKPLRLYRVAVKVLSGLVKFLFFADIQGTEHMPQEGACLVCGNHISNWDPIFVAMAVKRPVHFMAKVQLFRIPVLGKLLRTLGAFPVDRDAADIGAIKTALTYLKYGEPLGVFPQGKRLRGEKPQTQDIKSGVGMMVYRTEAPVIPIAIYTKNYKVRLFRRVHVQIGKPIAFEEYAAGAKSPEEYQRISNAIFDRICLLDQGMTSELPKTESGS